MNKMLTAKEFASTENKDGETAITINVYDFSERYAQYCLSFKEVDSDIELYSKHDMRESWDAGGDTKVYGVPGAPVKYTRFEKWNEKKILYADMTNGDISVANELIDLALNLKKNINNDTPGYGLSKQSYRAYVDASNRVDKFLDSFSREMDRGEIDLVEQAVSPVCYNKEDMLNAYWAGIEGSINDYSESKVIGNEIIGIKAGKGGELWLSTYKPIAPCEKA
jgi:hypothetical protein